MGRIGSVGIISFMAGIAIGGYSRVISICVAGIAGNSSMSECKRKFAVIVSCRGPSGVCSMTCKTNGWKTCCNMIWIIRRYIVSLVTGITIGWGGCIIPDALVTICACWYRMAECKGKFAVIKGRRFPSDIESMTC